MLEVFQSREMPQVLASSGGAPQLEHLQLGQTLEVHERCVDVSQAVTPATTVLEILDI